MALHSLFFLYNILLMPKQIFTIVVSFFITTIAFAQNKKLKATHGEWTAISYSSNIIKLVFIPTGYKTNENITNAVIAKPLQKTSMPVRLEGNTLIAGKNKAIRIRPAAGKDGYNGFDITLNDDEKIFGGGERALPLNRRGYKFPLYNNPWYSYSYGADALNFSVPFFTSSNGYGLFFDNASRGYADIGKTNNNVFEAGFVSGELNVFIIFGKDYKEILSSYFKLTGTQPLPPRWALGNLMSRFGYGSEAETKAIAEKMKKENIPFDAIIYDLFWFGDSIKRTMGNLDWVNKTAWPDPKKMINDFKKDNIHSVLIAEPFVLESTKQYKTVKKYFAVDSAGKPFRLTDFYFGYGGLLDIFRKDAGDWIWKNHYKKQLANGVTGWWTDLGEPEKHPSALLHNVKSLGVKRPLGADEVHNIYGHYWNKMLYENYVRELPNERLFHLNRSGFAGSQRYSIFPWSGDVSRSWSGLQAQVPLMLGMSMSGIPYIHADAGGFAGGQGDNELYVRWLQFAAFTPIFRPHGTALFEKDTAAYSFPSEPALIDTPWRYYAANAVKLRYVLLPYNYTLAYKQASKGEPLVAPLYYYYPKDTMAANVNNEYLWGENILVAPVLEKNAEQGKVYLPEGEWYSFFDGDVLSGASWATVPVTISYIPLFVKAGSFIPYWPRPVFGQLQSTAEYDDTKTVSVRYHPSENNSTGILYNDDGKSKKANADIITFKGVKKGNTVTIELSTNNTKAYANGFKRHISLETFKELDEDAEAIINGKKINKETMSDNTHVDILGFKKHLQYVEIDFDGKPVKIELTFNKKETE